MRDSPLRSASGASESGEDDSGDSLSTVYSTTLDDLPPSPDDLATRPFARPARNGIFRSNPEYEYQTGFPNSPMDELSLSHRSLGAASSETESTGSSLSSSHTTRMANSPSPLPLSSSGSYHGARTDSLDSARSTSNFEFRAAMLAYTFRLQIVECPVAVSPLRQFVRIAISRRMVRRCVLIVTRQLRRAATRSNERTVQYLTGSISFCSTSCSYIVLLKAYKVLSSLEEERDWNKEFQRLMELPDSEDKFTELRHLAQDFLDVGMCSFLPLMALLFGNVLSISDELCEDHH